MDQPNLRTSDSRTGVALDLTDPQPVMAARSFWRYAAQFATVGIFIIMLGAMLDLARVFLLPVVSAIVIGTMFGPLMRVAGNYRIPPWASATLLVVLLLLLLQAATLLISAPIVDTISQAATFADALKVKLQVFADWFNAFRDLLARLSAGQGDSGLKIDPAAVLQPALAFLTPAVGELLVFFATLFAFLLGRDELRKDLVLVFKDQDDRLRMLRIINDIEHNLTRYIGTVSVINLAIGLITAFGTWLIGFKNPALLGALAFVCNYIPYIGPAFICILLFVVGLISFPSLAYAALAPLLFIALTTIEGHFVTPNIVGKRLTLNPLAVIVALTFWTWMWGPVGTFLSMPLLIIGLIVLNHLVSVEDAELPG